MLKNPSANAGNIRDVGLIPELGRSPRERNGTNPSILAQRIPWTEEPGGLPFMGSHRVRHDLSDLSAAASAYLRLLIFLPAILISACASSCPVFLMMYSTYKLNKHGDNIRDVLLSYLEPICCSMSSSNSCFLICMQISQEAGQVVWCSHLFMNFPVCCDLHS